MTQLHYLEFIPRVEQLVRDVSSWWAFPQVRKSLSCRSGLVKTCTVVRRVREMSGLTAAFRWTVEGRGGSAPNGSS